MMKSILLKWGLTRPMISMMIKGAVPPAIATAMGQSLAVSTVYGNSSFVIILAAVMSLHLLPRHRYLKNLLVTTIMTGTAASWTLLAQYLGVKARQQSTPVGEGFAGYNAAASGVNAVFLVVAAWLFSSLRAVYPQYTIPFVVSTIFSMIGIMLGPDILTVNAGCTVTSQLLTSYLTGFGLAAAVGLILFPRTCRSQFRRQSRSFLASCQKLLEAKQKAFESALACGEIGQSQPAPVNESFLNVSNLGTTLAAIMAQMTDEVSNAAEEIAVGYQSPDMLKGILLHLQALLVPLLGLSRFDRIDQQFRHGDLPTHPSSKLHQLTLECFEETRQVLEVGVRHVLLTILNEKGWSGQKSGPSQAGRGDSQPPSPGNSRFAEYLVGRLQTFESYREDKVKTFRCHDIHKHEDVVQDQPREYTFDQSPMKPDGTEKSNHSDQMEVSVEEFQQLIFFQYLLRSVSGATGDLVQYSDKMQISPKTKRSLFVPVFGQRNSSQNVVKSDSPGGLTSKNELLAELELTRDPEHRLPTSSLQSLGDRVRYVLRLLLSDASQFGLRVAAATVSLGIIGFLPQTRQFFVEYRLAWAMIMIPISMSPTSGNSINGFAARVLGTVFAMVMAYANWYIVNGHPAGVVVFFFISMLVYYYFLLRFPQFNILFLLAAVNHVLIIGYELQVGVLGTQGSAASGPKYFPMYILAPYRLLSVMAGLFVALFWTIFPTQISEHSILHKKMNMSLSLLVEYCGLVSGTLHQRVHDLEGDLRSKSSPGQMLKAARLKTLYRELALLAEMRAHSSMTVYELSIGGKFPKKEYDLMINEIQRIVALLSVVPYVSQVFHDRARKSLQYENALQHTERSIHQRLMATITVLSIIASSMFTGSRLPPRLSVELARSMAVADAALHDEAIIAIDVVTQRIFQSTDDMIQIVKEIVGELNFAAGQNQSMADGTSAS